MPSREVITKFVEMVEAGQFVVAMERFYAAEAIAQENNESPRVGLPALIEHERKTLATFERIDARSVDAPLIDGDIVVIHWEFAFHHKSGAFLRLDELAWQQWRGDKLVAERFFYDPRQLQPGGDTKKDALQSRASG